ncbi:paraquat-inducible protein A [Pedobacter duraquae]|uniref:Paraquat-inducible protein A n=1 Tax=Pedobacter duraquae TaxID=425511 RepID=A0A4R6IR17_9SPHI|nr:paraquat-inducible protein A [Pedobacter duraquae]TDO24651.1 paraquat-inducible protein A [Pedobacter duraquae]
MTTQDTTKKFKNSGLANGILILGLSILLFGLAYSGYHLYALSTEREQIKEDYSMANNITFGLFSVDQWRDRIVAVVDGEVQDFSMTKAQKKALQKQVEKQLHGLITTTMADINKPQKSLGGKLKKLAVNTIVNADQIHAQVPSFSKTIIDKVNSPKSQARLKNIASSKVDQLEKETYDSTSEASTAVTKSLFNKYHVANTAAFNKQINAKLDYIHKISYNYLYVMLGCVVFALCLWWLMRKQVQLQTTLFVMSLLFALVLLTVGVTASIIEVDARIQTLNFSLLGEKITFDNQVLFFQSKSILGIVEVLIKQPKPDSIVVGALILLFIIILPMIRLIAKGIHVLGKRTFADNKVIKYLTFESAKWDMADVMVVGILMTYIGLNGILKSQLSNLNIHTNVLTTETANYSTLQFGYFVFVGYVVFETILSRILKRMTPEEVA